MVAPETKFVPVKVTGTEVPAVPELGVIELRVGGGRRTVKALGALVPWVVVTVTLLAPVAAPAAMAKVAVICEELTTLTLLTVISGLELATVARARKLEPLMVTGTELPRTPLDGLRELMPGRGAVMAKVAGALVPLVVVTVTLKLPTEALAAMAKVAVIELSLVGSKC